jgi:hypothetical protein
MFLAGRWEVQVYIPAQTVSGTIISAAAAVHETTGKPAT